MSGMNEAYDLSLFEAREPRLVALEENKKVVRRNGMHTRIQSVMNVVAYLALAIVAMGLVGYLITCNVRLTEMNKTIADCQVELNTLKSEQVRLEADLAGKTSAGQVSQYAQQNGMLTADSSQIYYISSEGGDVVSLTRDSGSWLQRAWGAVQDFFG